MTIRGSMLRAVAAQLSMIAAVSLWASAVIAQTYPTRAIKLVVPLAQGGPADYAARVFAPMLAESLGQNVVVENRSGASGVVGTEFVINGPADGYTLLFGSSSVFAVNPAVMKDLRFDVSQGIKLVGLVAQTEFTLVARPGAGIASIADLVGKAKSEPGKLSYGSSGTGGVTHMGTELFNLESGVNLLHIPFRGGGPALIGVLANDADLGLFGIGTMLTQIKSGKLVALATASEKRSALLPEVPTFGEAGYPKVIVIGWYGLGAPAKIPADAFEKLDTATARVAASAAFHAGLERVGLEPLMLNAAGAAPLIAREIATWARVAKAASIVIKP